MKKQQTKRMEYKRRNLIHFLMQTEQLWMDLNRILLHQAKLKKHLQQQHQIHLEVHFHLRIL